MTDSDRTTRDQINDSWNRNSYTVRRPVAYDESWLDFGHTAFVDSLNGYAMPVRFMAGIAPTDPEAYDWGPEMRGRIFTIPASTTVELQDVNLEVLGLLYGGDPRPPLAQQELPGRGQE